MAVEWAKGEPVSRESSVVSGQEVVVLTSWGQQVWGSHAEVSEEQMAA